MNNKLWSGTIMHLNLSKFIVFVLTIVLGISISFQIKNLNNGYEYVPLKVIYDYQKSLEIEKAENENLEVLIENYKMKIKEYEDTKAQGGDIEDLLKNEIEEFKALSGYTEIQGPGIIIIMDDASRELYDGEDPNNVLVHEVDVLNIVNDLKIAGAEAISINGQRLLSTSELNCSSYTIKINNQEYAQPFIIKAIGEPKVLEAAIKAPGTYANLLKDYGLFIEANTSVNITIPRFSEEFAYKYLKIEEGD